MYEAQSNTTIDVSYPADLYNYSAVADKLDGLEAVTAEQVARFREQGYLAVENAFTPEVVRAALEGLLDLVDGKYPDYLGLEFEKGVRGLAPTLPREQKQDHVRKFWRFVEYEPRLKALAEHPKMLEVMTRLVGDAPVLFQDMALIKPPHIGREKPWHQDLAYFNVPVETAIVGIWIALDEATVENGCMQVVPGSHRQGPVVHFQRRDWQICDSQANGSGSLAVPLRPGGCLFFHCLLHHGTPANRSPHRRRAVQFHYKPASVDETSAEERLAVFGSEGKDVTC